MKPEVIKKRTFDSTLPINAGVIADEFIATTTGIMVRRVTYYDVLSGETFEFVTNEYNLPPGWIAQM